MSILARLKGLSFSQLFKLAGLFVQNPGYVFLTAQASKKALSIATKYYGNTHHKSNKANAFRHAVWNVLLGQAVYKKTQSLRQAQDWAQRFTDLHEELFVNRKMDRVMDLHNNAFGIQALRMFANRPEAEAIHFLREAAENAIAIASPAEAENHQNKLVYIPKS